MANTLRPGTNTRTVTENPVQGKNAAPAAPVKRAPVIEYEANGETVKLSFEHIKRYLVSGDPDNVTDAEVMMFANLCRFQHLNPFLREAYLIKYGNKPATMVVGKDVHLKRAMKCPAFKGMQAGILVANKQGQITEREGAMYIPELEKLVGGWCRVYIAGWEKPFYGAAALQEYIQLKDGRPNRMWAGKPATMIRKVAVAQALREAFPDINSQLYAPEEMGEASEAVLPEDPVVVTVEETAPAQKPQAAPETAKNAPENPAAALFG